MAVGSRKGRGSLLDLLEQPEQAKPRPVLSLLPAQQSADAPAPVAQAPEPDRVNVAPPSMPAPLITSREEELDRLEQALAEARRAQQPKPPVQPTERPPEPRPEPSPAAPQPVGAPLSALLSPVSIFHRLLRKWHWILLGGLTGAAIAALYSLTLPNEYQAISRIVLEPRGITPIRDTVSPQGLNNEATIAYSQSQVDIIRSISVLDPVIEEQDLLNDPEFVGGGHWLDDVGLDGLRRALVDPSSETVGRGKVLEEMAERLYVGRLNQSFVIEIGFISEDPSKAARIANAVTRSYLASESGAQNRAAESATSDLTSRLSDLRAKVAAGETLIEAHKRKFNLVETNGRLVDEDSLARLNDQLAAATAQTAEARSRVELLREIDVNDVAGGGLPGSLQTPAISQARLQYQRAQSTLSRLAVKLGERHPQRREAAAEVGAAADSIRAELQRITDASARELVRSQRREADLRASVGALRDRALETNAPKAQLRELERRLAADRSVYESFLQRSRETGEQTGLETRNARIISEALPPKDKVGPARTVMTIAGGVVGSGVAALLALLPLLFAVGRGLATDVPSEVPASRPVRRRRKQVDDLYETPKPAPARSERERDHAAAVPEPRDPIVMAAPVAEPALEPAAVTRSATEPTPSADPIEIAEPVVAPKRRLRRKRRKVVQSRKRASASEAAAPKQQSSLFRRKQIEPATGKSIDPALAPSLHPATGPDPAKPSEAERLRAERDDLAAALERTSAQKSKAWDDGVAAARREAAILEKARLEAERLRREAAEAIAAERNKAAAAAAEGKRQSAKEAKRARKAEEARLLEEARAMREARAAEDAKRAAVPLPPTPPIWPAYSPYGAAPYPPPPHYPPAPAPAHYPPAPAPGPWPYAPIYPPPPSDRSQG